jgi:hypothetical protein
MMSKRYVRGAASAAVVAAALAGCGAASGTASSPASSAGKAKRTSMAGMNMGAHAKHGLGMTLHGVKAIPTRQLASTTWQGMKIIARQGTAVPFLVFDGTRRRMVKPGPKSSFHLMVMLNDAHTGVAIPYATVWATIRRAGKVVYDERQWPMISAFMGPHYGNNVALPGSGTYQLSLLISPPVAARHLEYRDVWLKPHRINLAFHWKSPA